MVVRTCNPSTQEAETEVSYVPGLPGLHNKTLTQKTKKDQAQWLTVVILATRKAEIGKIAV
jgi:hypothetical protein